MKKTFTLLFLTILLMGSNVSAQNLLAGLWDGNGITGTTSKPSDVGWLNTYSGIPWTIANGSGGCRFRDYSVTGGHTGFTNEVGGTTVTTRQLMLRFDNGSYSSSTYAFPVTLDACTSYTFSMDYVCGGSGTPPKNITVGISTTSAATGRLSSKTFTTTSSTTIYRNGTYTFTTGATSGTYYITFTGDAVWFGINNLSIVRSTDQSMNVSSQYMFFDNSTDNITKKFIVQGSNLTSAITLTAPSGISLSPSSISAANAQCGVTVTATYDNAKFISNDTIYATSGSFTKKIVVDAIYNNLIGNWDGDGDTAKVVAPLSLPSKYGWTCPTITWAAANTTTAGTCRYFDNPASYTVNGLEYKGRILYLRWDKSNTDTTNGVFYLPVALQANKYYLLGGKFAWNSNASAPTIRLGVYANSDTTSTNVSLSSIQTTISGALIKASNQFSVPLDGTYYISLKSNTFALAGIADLFLSDVTTRVTDVEKKTMVSTNIVIRDGKIIANFETQLKNTEMAIYNLQGMKLSSVMSGKESSSIESSSKLPHGMYLVRITHDNTIIKTSKVVL